MLVLKSPISKSGLTARTSTMVVEELEHRYAKVKSEIIKPENYEKVKQSWPSLLNKLEDSVREIEAAGSNYIPEVEWSEIEKTGKFPLETERLFKEKGVCIVRGLTSREQAEEWKNLLQDYSDKHKPLNGPVFKEAHWSKTQTQARSHPNIIKLMKAAGKLWKVTDPDNSLVDKDVSVVYSDRSRIRQPGYSVALNLHLDSGSTERWEDPLYREVYREIWDGDWDSWDPWVLDKRIDGQQDLYADFETSKGSTCSAFRSLQGWIALSTNKPGEGTLKVLPNLKEVVPYLLLKPFFEDSRTFKTDGSNFPGTIPGVGQFFASDSDFPHIRQESSVIPIPEVSPGDFVFWHADVLHEVDKEHHGKSDSSAVYIAQTPLTIYNIQTLEDNAVKFLTGDKPKDFEHINKTVGYARESDYEDRSKLSDILSEEGYQALGLKPYDTTDLSLSKGAHHVRHLANKTLSKHQLKFGENI